VILNLSDFIVKDFVYKQSPDGSYALKDGELIRENINDVIDTILEMLEKIYNNLITLNNLNLGRTECDVYLLNQALTRYSRDLFGELRLDGKIQELRKKGTITEKQQNSLAKYYDYGFKIDSRAPYIHRQLSIFLYWLSLLKPFAVYPDGPIAKPLAVAFKFHNEYISYLLALALLKTFDRTIRIHRQKDLFYDFLYDLHYRNLSRSSLEYFLFAYVEKA
jgi:hypothetical protein